jgi:hypothetical protein
MGELGFDRESLGSITIGYSKGRIITYKLIDQFDIDTLASLELFEFKRQSKARNGETITSVLSCKIRGIRRPRGTPSNDPPTYMDEGFRWIKIEGAEYRLDKAQISGWLEFWGMLASEITEDRNEEDDDDSEGGHSTSDPDTNYRLSKLRGQGLDISLTPLPNANPVAHPVEHMGRSKLKIDNNGRGRGRSKTSLN